MPEQKQVQETYWCPGGWPWQWFNTCKRIVTKWCYRFSWTREQGYGVYSSWEGCEAGTKYTWSKNFSLSFGTHDNQGTEMCFDGPLARAGACDENPIGAVVGFLEVDKDRYAAFWEKTNGPGLVSHHAMTPEQYQQTFNELTPLGYRPTCIAGYGVDGQERYVGIWEQTGGPPWIAKHALTAAQYQQTVEEFVRQGYLPVIVSGYVLNGQDFYALVMEKTGGTPLVARHGLTAAQYQQVFDEYVPKGYRPTCISGYALNGQDRYAGIWQQKGGPAWAARHALTSAQYQQAAEEFNKKGFRPTIISGYMLNGETRYAAVWEKTNGPAWEARHELTPAEYQQLFDQFSAKGYRVRWVSGYA